MDLQVKTRRFGAVLLMAAVIARLCVPGTLAALTAFLTKPEILTFGIYIQTGIDTRSVFSPTESTEPPQTAPAVKAPPPTQPEPTAEPAQIPLPAPGEMPIYYGTRVEVDIEALTEAPVKLSMQEGLPAVLIYSTHTSESYTPGAEPYTASAQYRTLDAGKNMLSLGETLEKYLHEAGIATVRDTAVHDSPSYNYAYSHARKSAQSFIKENPSVCLVLDLHRDAVELSSGQLRTEVPGADKPTAQIMLVVGTNQSGLSHDGWQDNLSMALKLNRILEGLCPGITRPLSIRAQRFNQDLSPGAILVEIGAAGNTRAEALNAVEILAQAISELFRTCGS